MTTSVTDRLVGRLIDSRGMSYGDEQERLRYYEAHSAMLQLQSMIAPIAAAVAILIGGRSVVRAVLVVWLVPSVSGLVGARYLANRNVPTKNLAVRSWRRIAFVTALTLLPFLAIWRIGETPDDVGGFATGAVTGLAVMAGVLVFLGRQKRKVKAD